MQGKHKGQDDVVFLLCGVQKVKLSSRMDTKLDVCVPLQDMLSSGGGDGGEPYSAIAVVRAFLVVVPALLKEGLGSPHPPLASSFP